MSNQQFSFHFLAFRAKIFKPTSFLTHPLLFLLSNTFSFSSFHAFLIQMAIELFSFSITLSLFSLTHTPTHHSQVKLKMKNVWQYWQLRWKSTKSWIYGAQVTARNDFFFLFPLKIRYCSEVFERHLTMSSLHQAYQLEKYLMCTNFVAFTSFRTSCQ